MKEEKAKRKKKKQTRNKGYYTLNQTKDIQTEKLKIETKDIILVPLFYSLPRTTIFVSHQTNYCLSVTGK